MLHANSESACNHPQIQDLQPAEFVVITTKPGAIAVSSGGAIVSIADDSGGQYCGHAISKVQGMPVIESTGEAVLEAIERAAEEPESIVLNRERPVTVHP